MSSISPSTGKLMRAMNEHVMDDHNVLSLRYKYGMTTSQRIREIVKEIVNGKPQRKFIINSVAHAVDE